MSHKSWLWRSTSTLLVVGAVVAFSQQAPALEGSGSEGSGTAHVKPVASAGIVNHSDFDRQLKQFVNGSRVDYTGWLKGKVTLDNYLARLAAVDETKLPRNERMAFHINLYNAATVQLILDHLPKGITSIKDIPSRWDQEFVQIKSGKISLNHIEHKILRPDFKDSRIHFAINCASGGCPDLAPDAYTAADLNAQLNKARDVFFANNTKGVKTGDEKGTLWGTNRTLRVSKIFDWFDDDFEREEGSIEGYVRKHGTAAQKAYLSKHKGDITVSYFDYDWKLNGK